MPESVPPAPVPALSGNDLLSLAHRDPEAASAKLRLLAPEAQAQACCEVRAELSKDMAQITGTYFSDPFGGCASAPVR